MLYTSTRGDKDAFTAPRTLAADNAPDGGLFVPFRLPSFSPEEMLRFAGLSFGEAVAEILNVFFSCRLTGWDVDFAVGRNPVKFHQMNHRLFVGELWHNAGEDYNYLLRKLHERIRLEESGRMPTDWARVAIRIAVLFGVFSCLMKEGSVDSTRPVDLAVAADDFAHPMAAWYGRKMGLPIGTITCGCITNSGLWDLLSHGEYNGASVPAEFRAPLERFLRETLGTQASVLYGHCCDTGRTYSVPEQNMDTLRSGMFAAVVGKTRISSLVDTVFKTSGYRLSEEAALAYGALQDYRARNTVGRNSLILSDSRSGL